MSNSCEIDFNRFYELSIDMLCIATMDGYFLSVNQAFCSELGYNKETLLSKPFNAFIHPEDQQATSEELSKLGKGCKTFNFKNRYRHQSGHYLTLSWSAQIDHEKSLIYGLARNISDEINQSNKLKQIEKALENETILGWTDKNGVITYVNENFSNVSGYSKDELVGQTHKIINSGYHSDLFFRNLWKTISSGQIWTGVIKNKKKSGEFYYVQTIIIPVRDHEHNILNYLSIRQDITKSIISEAELKKTLDILNETNAIAKVGGWELDIETNKLTWTDETFKILEVDKREGHTPVLKEGLSLFTPAYQPIIEKAVNEAINTGKPYSLELEALTAKGNVLWVYTNGKANYENGKIVSLSGTIQDIHEKKLAEIKLNHEQQKSIQSAKLASLGELAASMAHEINNPLGVISGYAELISLSETLSEDMSKKIDVILKSCERIAHIVRNLKRFAQPEKQKTKTKTSLSNIVNEAISLANPRLKNERIKLDFLNQTSAKVLCNEIEMEQVILNLINNSIDALKETEDKWIEINVTNTGKELELKITDSGKGVPVGIDKQIFEPFYSTKPTSLGTGLGLSIVSDILHSHQGTIELNRREKNTCFIIKIPLVES